MYTIEVECLAPALQKKRKAELCTILHGVSFWVDVACCLYTPLGIVEQQSLKNGVEFTHARNKKAPVGKQIYNPPKTTFRYAQHTLHYYYLPRQDLVVVGKKMKLDTLRYSLFLPRPTDAACHHLRMIDKQDSKAVLRRD